MDPNLGDLVHYVLAEDEQRAAIIAGNFWDSRAPLWVLPGAASESPRFVASVAMDRVTQAVGTFHHPADALGGAPAPAPQESPFIGAPAPEAT